jgi:hypothetical protein
MSAVSVPTSTRTTFASSTKPTRTTSAACATTTALMMSSRWDRGAVVGLLIQVARCRAERAQKEIDFLTQELTRALGFGARTRRAGSHAERARVNVTRAIAGAVRKIAHHHAALGRHLSVTIRTGLFCSYVPDPRARVQWVL